MWSPRFAEDGPEGLRERGADLVDELDQRQVFPRAEQFAQEASCDEHLDGDEEEADRGYGAIVVVGSGWGKGHVRFTSMAQLLLNADRKGGPPWRRQIAPLGGVIKL